MRFSELDGALIGVWGVGRETRSFATHVERRLPGARIVAIAVDDPNADRGWPLTPGPPVVSGAAILPALRTCDVVVRSPGVSIYRPELAELRADGMPVTTATALWLAERHGRRIIGVTGTKGKSTTATLAFHVARAAGHRVQLAGNIGSPALDLLDAPADDVAIVELSSYQIADLDVGPEVVAYTNLYREHVDWHGSDEAYRVDKLRALSLPGVRVAVIPADDEAMAAAARGVEVRPYGTAAGWHVVDYGIALRGTPVVAAHELPLPGEHNARNLCAALTALEAAGLVVPDVPAALAGFRPLPHRLEVVLDHAGVLWVDDSISTTPESTLAALATFRDREIILLGGGHDRGQDYGALAAALAACGARVIGMPTTGARLVSAARRAGIDEDRAVEAPDLPTAVALARASLRPGVAVLLSPAAPSYNAYRSFEARGDHFRALASAVSGS
jgi:UDP-N-acetylmuramoyl-L-alanine---L-glutamate ligase